MCAFKSLNDWHENYKKEIHGKQFVILSDGTQRHATEFEDKSVSMDEYSELRMNSYALDVFFSKMSDELLIERANYYIRQCGKYRYPATTYDEALIHVILPELIKRFQEITSVSKEQVISG